MERFKGIMIIFLLVVGLVGPATSAKSVSVLLQEGLYAEEIEGDLDAAIKIYEQITEDKSAQKTQVAQAMYRLGMCHIKKRDERQAKAVFRKLVAQFPEQTSIVNRVQPLLDEMSYSDPAELMPAETVIYLEFGSPGKQIEVILNILRGTPFANPLAAIGGGQKTSDEKTPGDIMAALLNPSMMAEFKKIRGMAAGFMQVPYNVNNPPMVIVLYPGKSDALRGIILAGLGVAGKPGELIDGMQTLALGEDSEAAGAAYDDNVIIISQPMEQLRWCVKQYKGVSDEATLVSQNKLFGRLNRKSRQESALTIWLDGAATYAAISEQMAGSGQAGQLRLVDGIADLQGIEEFLAQVSLDKSDIAVEASINFKDGHHCLLYDLIRTPNLSRAGFEAVPAEAVGVVSFALGEAESARVETAQKSVKRLIGLDIGREIFANIEQVTVFALPADAATNKSALAKQVSPVLGGLGVIVTSHNPQRTRQLLSELLIAADSAASASMGEQSGQPAGLAENKYRIGTVGDEPVYCYIEQAGKSTILALSNEVVQASLSSLKNRKSVLVAGPLRDALGGLPSDTSKLAVVNVGGAVRSANAHIHRAVDTAEEPNNYPLLQMLGQLAQACDNTSVQLRSGESVNSFGVRFSVSDLPALDGVLGLLMQLPLGGIPENLTAEAVRPRPIDGAVVNAAFAVKLKWLPGANAAKHRIYFGTKRDEMLLLDEVRKPSYDKLPELKEDTVYYWRVDEVSADGSVTAGEVWSFATTGKLVGWWKFDESSGSSALDSSGNGNEGMLHNMNDSARVSGVMGNALAFDGSDDYISVPDGGAVEFGDESFTVCFWMKTSTDTDNSRIIVNGTSGTEFEGATGKRYEILNEPTDNQLVFAIDDNVTKSFIGAAIADFIADEWVHVVAVRDRAADELRLYRNGERKATAKDNTGDISSPGEGLYIGASQAEDGTAGTIGNFFAGMLDDIRIYNYALSAGEIGRIDHPGPVGWWKLDGDAKDSSGYNHHGTIKGDPKWVTGRIDGGLEFDGVDDFVDIADRIDLPVWTVALWVKSPAAPSSGPMSGPVHRGENFHISWNHPDPLFRGAANVQAEGKWYASNFEKLKSNRWYYLCATYDGKTLKAYRDGALISNNPDPSGIPDNEEAPLTFGKHSTVEQYFKGTVDDVRIYNQALSGADIKVLYEDVRADESEDKMAEAERREALRKD